MRRDPETAPDPRNPSGACAQRVNRATDHVLRNLDQPLKVEGVARAAGFCPFHCHRVFRPPMGETPSDFVQRVRPDRDAWPASLGWIRWAEPGWLRFAEPSRIRLPAPRWL